LFHCISIVKARQPEVGGKWGECGCQLDPVTYAVDCYYNDINGGFHMLNGSDVTKETADAPMVSYAAEEWTSVISQMTMQQQFGQWLPPQLYTTLDNVTYELSTFTVPLQFDNTTGKCNLAVSIDIRVGFLSEVLQYDTIANNDTTSTLALVYFNQTTDALVASNRFANNSIVGMMNFPTVYPSRYTPDAAVNDLTRTCWTQLEFLTTPQPKPLAFSNGDRLVEAFPLWHFPFALGISTQPQVPEFRMGDFNALTSSYVTAAAAFLDGRRKAVMRTAAAMSELYTAGDVNCFNGMTPSTLNFLTQTLALQSSHGMDMAYMYVSARATAGGIRGDCGCQLLMSANTVQCYFTNSTGYMFTYNGSNTAGPTVVPPHWVDQNAEYLNEIFSMTPADLANGGKHLQPSAWADSGTGEMMELVSYSIPIAFDASGNLLAAATIDFRISAMQEALHMLKPSWHAEVILIDTRGPSGTFLASSNGNRSLLGGALYAPTQTPVGRINDFSFAVWSYLQGSWTINQMWMGPYTTFIDGGMQYDVVADGSFLVAQRSPLITEAKAAGIQMDMLINTYQAATQTIANLYQQDSIKCPDYASSTAETTLFLQSVAGLSAAFGVGVPYVYMSYQVPNSNAWGDCGCGFYAGEIYCYYSDTSAATHYLAGASLQNETEAPSVYDTAEEEYTRVIMNATQAQSQGFWHLPTRFEATDANMTLITYTVPLQWDSVTGKCILAASIDVALENSDMTNILLAAQMASGSTSQFAFLDLRGQGTYLASASAFYGNGLNNTMLYSPPSTTPSQQLNDLANAALAGIQMTPDVLGVSFSQGGLLYNTFPVRSMGGMFALVEVRQALMEQIGSTVAFESQGVQDAIAAVSGQFNALKVAAVALGTMFKNSNTDCTTLNTNAKAAITAAYALLEAFDYVAAYAYVAVKEPTFTVCGCDHLSESQVDECSYINSTGYKNRFVGANFSAPTGTAALYPQNAAYLQQFWASTSADAANGIWNLPETWVDLESGLPVDILTFAWPFAFDSNGNTIAVAAIDYRYSTFSQTLQAVKSNLMGESLIVDLRTQHGTVLGASDAAPGQLSGQLYSPTNTPNPRINEFSQVITNAVQEASSAAEVNPSSLPPNYSPITQDFTLGAMQYNSAMFQNWAVAQRTPVALPFAPVATALMSYLMDFQRGAAQAASTYTLLSSNCSALSSSSGSSPFLQAAHAIQRALNTSAIYTYISYQMAGGKWGECGCALGIVSGDVNCYYINAAGMLNVLDGADVTKVTTTATYTVESEIYTQEIAGLTAANQSGAWL
jgi:hypothetical protein